MTVLGFIWEDGGGHVAGPGNQVQGEHRDNTQMYPLCKQNGEKQPLPERSTQETKLQQNWECLKLHEIRGHTALLFSFHVLYNEDPMLINSDTQVLAQRSCVSKLEADPKLG